MDSKTFASSCSDGTMRVWSVATGAHKEGLDGGSFAFSKDSSSAES
jgi:WD40 repeat protein